MDRGWSASRRILQNEVTDRGVGRRDMIEAVRDFRLWAVSDDIRHRATRNEPHHEFDAFGSRLADIFDVGRLRQAFGSSISWSRNNCPTPC